MESSGKKRILTGIVISDKMSKAVTVQMERRKMHPLYKKFVTTHKKFKARDEKNEAKAGDVVKVEEIRPLSREIRWKVIEIVEKAEKEKA